jgi:hypothetical protein
MKKFLFRSLIALVPVLLVLLAAECYVRSLPNTYRFKEDWMRHNGQLVSTLLLGNSHGYYDLVPSEMDDSTFNLANVSQRPEHDYHLLKRYAPLCPNLKKVVIVADNSNLFDIPMEDEEPGRATYYQLYMGYEKHSPLSRYGFEISSMVSFWAKIKNHLKGNGLDCDSLGWGKNYRAEWRDPSSFDESRMRLHLFLSHEATRMNMSYVDSIAAWCQDHNVRLLLLQTPVCTAYTKKTPVWQLDYVRRQSALCMKRYGAMTVDFTCNPLFTDDDFFDPDHLNDQGARKFSRLLFHYLSKKKN